jgi:hypothetical protein
MTITEQCPARSNEAGAMKLNGQLLRVFCRVGVRGVCAVFLHMLLCNVMRQQYTQELQLAGLFCRSLYVRLLPAVAD